MHGNDKSLFVINYPFVTEIFDANKNFCSPHTSTKRFALCFLMFDDSFIQKEKELTS